MTRIRDLAATRRGFLSLAAGSAALAASGGAVRAQRVRTSARIAIVGAGAGGTAITNRLAGRLEGATITIIDDDIARRKGTRERVQMIYNANNETLFGVPIVHHKLRQLFDERGIETRHSHVLKAIDGQRKIATYATPDGDVEAAYDLINVIPPQRAPQVVRESGLGWADRWTDQGWIKVDMQTLRHLRYPNVFGIGDINGVPKGKTAASVKWHQPVVEDHLVSDIAGGAGTETFNGYTSCPMITRIGRAMLIEFDYDNNLTPSFPGIIAPLEELWISWLMKEVALQPTYNAMLRGLA